MKRPSISIRRGAEIYRQMVALRREVCADTEFMLMTDFWQEWITEEGYWKIKKYPSSDDDDYLRRAAVNVLGNRVTLIVDRELWSRAEQGTKLLNEILAHEFSHVALSHHATGVRNFKLSRGQNGMVKRPPNEEELEADLGAVFLQCGIALENPKWNATELAARAFAEVSSVRKAQSYVRLDDFQRELRRPPPSRPSYPCVVL